MISSRQFLVCALAIGLVATVSTFAEHTRTWRQSEFSEFERGTANGVAIRSDGKLMPAPKFTSFSDPNLAYLWALRMDPNYADAHSNLGSVYLVNFGEVDQAMAEYEAALRANPNLFQVQVNLGNLYVKTNRAADAIPRYTSAIKTQPNDADAYAGLGFALLLTGHANDAIPQFETAVRLSPNSADTHNNFGLALLQLNRFDDAASQFTETLRLNPQYPNAQENLDKSRQAASANH